MTKVLVGPVAAGAGAPRPVDENGGADVREGQGDGAGDACGTGGFGGSRLVLFLAEEQATPLLFATTLSVLVFESGAGMKMSR